MDAGRSSPEPYQALTLTLSRNREMRDAKHGRSEGYRDLRDVLKRADMDDEGRGQPDDSGREMVSYGDI